MRIAICDDENAQCQLLESYLKEYSKQEKVLIETVSFPNAESLLFLWEDDKNFDLLILDIEMGDLSGMDLAFKLRNEGSRVPMLFITGYEDYMSQGYEVEALHYLLKPLQKARFFDVLNRLRSKIQPESKILLQAESGAISIVPSDIWYIEASGHFCNLTTADKVIELRHSISEMKNILNGEKGIVQNHRSYIVNLQHVSSLMQNELIMDDGVRLPVSRGSAKTVSEAFVRYYKG